MEKLPSAARRPLTALAWLGVAALYGVLAVADLSHARDRARREVADPAGARLGDLRLRDGRHGDARGAGAVLGLARVADAADEPAASADAPPHVPQAHW